MSNNEYGSGHLLSGLEEHKPSYQCCVKCNQGAKKERFSASIPVHTCNERSLERYVY